MAKLPAAFSFAALLAVGVGLGFWFGWAVGVTAVGGLVWLDISLIRRRSKP